MYIKEILVFSPSYTGKALMVNQGKYPKIDSLTLTPDEEEELLEALLKRKQERG